MKWCNNYMKLLEGKKIYIYTLGCKVNQYESDAMLEKLLAAGAIKGTEDDADICIVNTCSVTNMADRKSRQILSRMRKQCPDALLIATGCYVQACSSELLENQLCHIIMGNNRKKDVVRIISEFLSERITTDNIIDINKDSEFEDLKVNMPETHTRAYIKIQDGCNSFCSYCIIPFLRGRIRNKPIDEIYDEVANYANNGVKEVVLTGINISSYGDIGEYDLADVICRISSVDGIERIRLGSLEPRVITDEFLERISSLPKVCPHFHLSLQSVCDKTLKNMNRKYTVDDIKRICTALRKTYKFPALTADIIVGFPGETDEDFEVTRANLEELNLYEMHVFKFSRRKGTVADGMKDQVPETEKSKRSDVLLKMRDENMKNYNDLFKGDTISVLVEEIVEKNGKAYYRGHTERYMDVLIPIQGEADPTKINTIIQTEY